MIDTKLVNWLNGGTRMTREIPLAGGSAAIVDDEDYDTLAKYTWRLYRGVGGLLYAKRKIKDGPKETVRGMHQDIITAPVGFEVDHRDGNGLNNVRSNLRVCTHAQNNFAHHKPTRGICRARGVFPSRNGFFARIGRFPIQYIGHFKTIEEASDAFWRAARLRYGEEFVSDFRSTTDQ